MPRPVTESALLIVVPEAEPVVGSHRRHYDAGAQVGVPAHVTVAYPFKPAEQLTDDDARRLHDLFACVASFPLVLGRIGWFGEEVLFLQPDEAEPIVSLSQRVLEAFPEYPLYGGDYEDIHPHLTVGQAKGDASVSAALRGVAASMAPLLPVRHPVDEVQLWSSPTESSPTWEYVRSFHLGA